MDCFPKAAGTAAQAQFFMASWLRLGISACRGFGVQRDPGSDMGWWQARMAYDLASH